MLNMTNILLPFVVEWIMVGSDVRFETRGLSTSSPDFPSRCNKETTARDTLASCCTHSLNRPAKKHSEKPTPKERQIELSHRLHAPVKIEVSYVSAQNTMHVSPMKTPSQLECTPMRLCIRVSEQNICEHDECTVCASPTNSPDERQSEKVVEILPPAS